MDEFDIQMLHDELDRALGELDEANQLGADARAWELECHIDDLTTEIQCFTESE